MKVFSAGGGGTRKVQGTQSLGMYISGRVQLPGVKYIQSIQQFIPYTHHLKEASFGLFLYCRLI